MLACPSLWIVVASIVSCLYPWLSEGLLVVIIAAVKASRPAVGVAVTLDVARAGLLYCKPSFGCINRFNTSW